ncbi:sensor domain-containing protein [Xanthomonas translucens]|uniref:sensor domain-containing protein n=3 Tax=Xanthomonas campestris pv. translucens TaxID=343 RepID=UPI00071E84D7|nr:bifunctional diguanylate cyclase/phosphodiesterase [Xanthomonas translucens]MCS3360242.1 EAL domain-containing protein [Xanthomonas translucens pv. translucens]MCS3373756.1 EAL domain-containing protein [Xanthomonas translucens pv. translucens]MCT8274225.1 EAL domain-containing protein [Xanthomonas translucens pv. translucens]MCT8278700.1 EAL domain-containing protein [Xanthomonas translucens pv. translucens]MCT8289817.1 EAL domain-containing protein [Xanthomonas translucens pv. translucens
MDQGVIASLLQHPLTSAVVLLDAEGRPLAANRAAQALELPRTVEAYAELMRDVRERLLGGESMLACALPGTAGRRLDGWLRAVRDDAGALLAYTLSVPEPVGSDGATRWEIALDSAEHGLWDWDIPSDKTFRSERWRQMLGYQGDAPDYGLNALLPLVHSDDQTRLREAIRAHFEGRSATYVCEFRLRQQDGQWRWILDRGRIVAHTADGSPLRMVGTHTDIHEQKLLEQRLRDQQTLLREAQRMTSMGSWSWDPPQNRIWWSREFLRVTGLTEEHQPSSRGWLRLLSRESAAQVLSTWRRMQRDGKQANFEVELVRGSEAPRHLRVWAQPQLEADGRIQRVLGQVQNITEQRQTDALIRWRTELLNRVSALGKIGGCEIEVGTRRMQWTEECYRIHGLRKETLELDQALALYTLDSRDAFEAALARIAQGGLPEQLDLCFHRPSGHRVWVQVLIELDDRDGLPPRFVVLFRDISREREASERIELLAHYDLLTGLPNRQLLREQAETAMHDAVDRGSTLAMLFVDLDGFKSINDSFGHATGDALLKLAATRMHPQLRTSDLFGRFSGDEFLVVLRDLAEPSDAGHVARKLIAALAEPLHNGENVIKIGASIGIAFMEDGRQDFDSLLRAADAAMYAAKESGRNTCHYYSQDVLLRAQRRLEIEHALHGALDREEFSLVYQPLVHAAGERAPAVEALLRWHRPGHGHCNPAEFIPIAEECGEIVRLGDWVINEACRQAAAWDAAGLNFDRVSVNVSAMQLRDRGFAERVLELCQRNNWSPKRLELELTESALIRDTESLRRCFELFEQEGVLLAVDDFGTGFSNLHYLNRFPVQRLKIDRSFVQDMLIDSGTAKVTQAIVQLGHALGMQVVAEGVETAQEEALLREQGCDEIQGYLHSRPLPPRELAAWLRARQSVLPATLPRLVLAAQ